ncbi:hypothetical protein EYF80_043952 [Liparis tanakae]|uniref:Uncharacterized protein n=1 Tax=Liparis tanakae TaxID=230148 RepID=A0A4Z2FZ77_9TELE|nr:hypothetical protein EYF80_043952 [Liparis tanakae]
MVMVQTQSPDSHAPFDTQTKKKKKKKKKKQLCRLVSPPLCLNAITSGSAPRESTAPGVQRELRGQWKDPHILILFFL